MMVMALCASPSYAEPLWFSNKIEIGYGPVYVAEQIKFVDGLFVSRVTLVGTQLKVHEQVKVKTFYLLEQKRRDDWRSQHSIGLRMDLTFP